MYLWSQCNSCQKFNEFFFIEIENICMDPKNTSNSQRNKNDLKGIALQKTVFTKP